MLARELRSQVTTCSTSDCSVLLGHDHYFRPSLLCFGYQQLTKLVVRPRHHSTCRFGVDAPEPPRLLDHGLAVELRNEHHVICITEELCTLPMGVLYKKSDALQRPEPSLRGVRSAVFLPCARPAAARRRGGEPGGGRGGVARVSQPPRVRCVWCVAPHLGSGRVGSGRRVGSRHVTVESSHVTSSNGISVI